MRLVSITAAGETIRLRRYETKSGQVSLTHEGRYDPEGVTAVNIGHYFDWGANQDRIPRPRAATAA